MIALIIYMLATRVVYKSLVLEAIFEYRCRLVAWCIMRLQQRARHWSRREVHGPGSQQESLAQ